MSKKEGFRGLGRHGPFLEKPSSSPSGQTDQAGTQKEHGGRFRNRIIEGPIEDVIGALLGPSDFELGSQKDILSAKGKSRGGG